MSLFNQLAERFWPKVDKDDDCWYWIGAIDSHGYGSIRDGSHQRGAHRVAYELLRGAIPEGLQIDHLCENRSCVNPDHLEAVTQAENVRRSAASEPRRACPQGHPYSGDNLLDYPSGRRCRICKAGTRRRSTRRHRRAALERR